MTFILDSIFYSRYTGLEQLDPRYYGFDNIYRVDDNVIEVAEFDNYDSNIQLQFKLVKKITGYHDLIMFTKSIDVNSMEHLWKKQTLIPLDYWEKSGKTLKYCVCIAARIILDSPKVAWQSEIVKFFNSQPWELRKEIILSERTYQIDNIWRCSIMPDDEFMFD